MRSEVKDISEKTTILLVSADEKWKRYMRKLCALMNPDLQLLCFKEYRLLLRELYRIGKSRITPEDVRSVVVDAREKIKPAFTFLKVAKSAPGYANVSLIIVNTGGRGELSIIRDRIGSSPPYELVMA